MKVLVVMRFVILYVFLIAAVSCMTLLFGKELNIHIQNQSFPELQFWFPHGTFERVGKIPWYIISGIKIGRYGIFSLQGQYS